MPQHNSMATGAPEGIVGLQDSIRISGGSQLFIGHSPFEAFPILESPLRR
jgi:hypothetical protein